MLNQFVKAFILVVITSATTYVILTFLPLEKVDSTSTSKEVPAEPKESLTNENATTKSLTKEIEQTQQVETTISKEPQTKEAIDKEKQDTVEPLAKSIDEDVTQKQLVLSSIPSDSQTQANIDSKQIEGETIGDKEAREKETLVESKVESTSTAFTFNTSTLAHLSPREINQDKVEVFCQELADKLRTVKYQGCLDLNLGVEANFKTVQDRSLTYRHFRPAGSDTPTFHPEKKETGRILFISGIHGDEYSAISITYLWMLNMLQHQEKNTQHWLFLPLTNPDGLFKSPATRINANNVDLNRNFPSPDWDELALDYWKNYYKRNKRRYPGESSNSEPETQWLVHLIEEFKPDAIISVHAPYGLVDYDGPEHAIPNKIGGLKHRELGTYPGSLGRYAGEYLKIPVLTLELRAAGSMPSDDDIYNMWRDVEEWTITKIRGENPGPIPNFRKQ